MGVDGTVDTRGPSSTSHLGQDLSPGAIRTGTSETTDPEYPEVSLGVDTGGGGNG